jgi:hypothetical protein
MMNLRPIDIRCFQSPELLIWDSASEAEDSRDWGRRAPRWFDAKKRVDARRANGGVDDADAAAISREQHGEIRDDRRFARPAEIGKNRDYSRHG